VAGEAAELLDALSAPRQVTLLDALPTIFPRQSDKFRQGVMDGLARARLELRTQQRITEVRPDAVVVGEEALPSDVTFWCAGVKPRALEGVDPKVRPTLESVARPDIYVLGDAAAFPRELDVAKLAQTAEQQAKVAAHNILQPGGPKLYQPEVKGLIVSIGHGYAVAEVAGGTVFTGPVPWHVKRQLYKAKIAMATYA
jgi:NADH dehydrogenase FAD-containing subunit